MACDLFFVKSPFSDAFPTGASAAGVSGGGDVGGRWLHPHPQFHHQPGVIRERGEAEMRVLTAAAAALSEERGASASSAGQPQQVQFQHGRTKYFARTLWHNIYLVGSFLRSNSCVNLFGWQKPTFVFLV